MSPSIRLLSKTAKVIVGTLLQNPPLKYQGPVRCPTTGEQIYFNTTKTWLAALEKGNAGHHCTWCGFSYLALSSTDNRGRGLIVVEIYRQDDLKPVGISFDGTNFIPGMS